MCDGSRAAKDAVNTPPTRIRPRRLDKSADTLAAAAAEGASSRASNPAFESPDEDSRTLTEIAIGVRGDFAGLQQYRLAYADVELSTLAQAISFHICST